MNELSSVIPSTPATCVDRMRDITATIKASYGKPDAVLKDVHDMVKLEHTFHAGVYARTMRAPAGVVLANDLIVVPTVLIISGDCTITDTERTTRVTGYHVLRGAANRMCLAVTHAETCFTMVYATDAKTVEEAEAEFADRPEDLLH